MSFENNIFSLSESELIDSKSNNIELFQQLIKTDNVLIERIISTGQTTPTNEWYDQERDEFVALLQGEAELLMEEKVNDTIELKTIQLKQGSFLNIPKHVRHRVEKTSVDPPCIWLAFHYK
ncbi:hypothetical protein ABK040_005097 [Willaertia magna]